MYWSYQCKYYFPNSINFYIIRKCWNILFGKCFGLLFYHRLWWSQKHSIHVWKIETPSNLLLDKNVRISFENITFEWFCLFSIPMHLNWFRDVKYGRVDFWWLTCLSLICWYCSSYFARMSISLEINFGIRKRHFIPYTHQWCSENQNF